MEKKIKVLLTEPIRPIGMAYLEREAEVLISPNPDPETVAGLAGDCDAIISRNTKIDQRVFSQAPKLKAVASHGVGTDHIDVAEATKRGIFVVNTPGANAQSVAETVAGFMLMLSRKIAEADIALRLDRDYASRNRLIGRNLEGTTLFIIGMGAIGRRLARIGRLGFGMNILGYDPYVSREELEKEGITKVDSLEAGLRQGDFVSLNCPYTGEMHHVINQERLCLMKKTAYLINCARGALVDDKALIAALKEGVIAGAALDVFSQEPPAADDPLFDCPNLLTTPHIGANAENSMDNMSLYSAMDVIAVLRGEYDKARVVNPQGR